MRHAQNRAAEIKLRAERRAGEMLAGMVKQKPGEYQRSRDGSVAKSMADIGINHNQSSRWQKVATVPEAEFEKHIKKTVEAEKELTTAGVLTTELWKTFP